MALHPDWREFLSLLHSRGVRFLLVGAHALAAHGYPRFTGDLDIFVERTPENASRILAVLTDFGFGHVGLGAADFTRPNRVAQLGFPPVRIDLLTSISGVSFRAAWEGRLQTELGGVPVSVLGIRELLRNKRASGRPKDLADAAALEGLVAAARAESGRSSKGRRPRKVR
jgi:hypothetical protein